MSQSTETPKLRHPTFNYRHFLSENEHGIQEKAFHLFPQLPIELRLRIWGLALEQKRLIPISLIDGSTLPHQPFKGTLVDKMRKQVGRNSYQIVIEARPGLTPILSVSTESRETALSCYRVRIPVFDGTDGTGPRIFYFNPERDILYLRDFGVAGQTLINLFNDISASDPRGVGILHLAINSQCTTGLTSVQSLKPEVIGRINNLDPFRETLLHLQSLWIVDTLAEEARIQMGVFSGTENCELGLNRSVPIHSRVVEFDLLSSDPRPILLKDLTVWMDPRKAVQTWEQLETNLGLYESGSDRGEVKVPTRQISYIISTCSLADYKHKLKPSIDSHEALDEFLVNEEGKWRELQASNRIFRQAKEPKKQQKELLSTAGFWIFPGDVFEGMESRADQINVHHMKERWPGLGVFRL